MAIFAQRTTFRSSVQFPDFRVPTEPDHGAVLVYDSVIRAFVACPQESLVNVPCTCPPSGGGGGGGGGSGTLNGAINLGSGSQVFKDILGDDLRFRTLIEGPGITLNSSANEIQITNDILATSSISVPHGFILEIDNDGTTTDAARFEIYTNTANASILLNPLVYDAPIFDLTIVADTALVNKGKIISAAQNWVNLGFAPGMCLRLDGTDEQDGIWKIDTITTTTNTNDTITITVPFTNASDAGQQPPTRVRGMFFEITGPLTLVARNRNFTSYGFVAGQSITILGTTNNDGSYLIGSITTTHTANDTIVLNAGGGSFPGPFGCDVSTISISGPITGAVPTGWWVNELGEMHSMDTTICGDLTVECGGSLSVDGDLIIGGTNIIDIINTSYPEFPDNGIIVQRGLNDFAGRAITVGAGLTITNGNGIAANPFIDVNDFIITLSGDVDGAGLVTNLGNVTVTTQLETITVPATYNQVTIDGKGRVVSGATIANQPLDSQLTNLAGGLSGLGYVVWNGASYINRLLVGQANQIEIVDADASSSNTLIRIVSNPVIPGSEAMTIPVGSNLQYPATPSEGMIRYNTNTDKFEGYVNGTWEIFNTNLTVTGFFLPLLGGTMTGDIIMNDNDIVLTTGLVDGRDVSEDGALLDSINSGTGFKVQTAPDTFTNRTILAAIDSGIVVVDGDGVLGNPKINLDILSVPVLNVGQIVDEDMDYILIHDTSGGETRRIKPRQLNNRNAFRYFMAQI